MPRSLSLCSCIIVASAMFSPMSAQVPGFPPPDWTYQSNLAFARLGTCVAPAGDVNGDGYADVIISAPLYDGAKGLVLLFLGSPSGLSSSPNWSISGSISGGFLSGREKAGDVNGDGFDDLLLNDGRLFFGSSSGVSDTFEATEMSNFYYTASAGDVDGDGYGDLAFQRDLWFGSPSGLSRHRWVKNVKGGEIPMVNDLNGDGYADVVLASFDASPSDLHVGNNGTGALSFFAGGPDGMSRRETGPGYSWVNGFPLLQPAGDVDGDGFNDFLLAVYANSPDTSPDRAGTRVLFMRGSDSGFIVSSHFYDSSGWYQFNEMDDAGDINGDGYDDVLIVDGDDLGQRLHVFAGGPGGPTASAILEDLDRLFSWGFERVARGAGDVNGDGYDDLIVGYPGFSDGQAQEGRVLLFLGRPGFPSVAQGIP